MTPIPADQGLYLAAALFALGLTGVLVRRNLLFVLMSLEVMLNAAGFAFVAAGARWGQADGQVMFLLVLTLAAAEVSIGLALLLAVHLRARSLDSDLLSRLRG
jgi:NADH-quinone oxidoreductase subunit K